MDHLRKSINKGYESINKLGLWAKALIVILLSLLLSRYINARPASKEAFGSNETLQLREGTEIYDDFYANVYDALTYVNTKNDFEINNVIKLTKPTKKSVILDVGSGTGHHVKQFAATGITNVTGVDNSKAMVKKAKELNPANKYVLGDVMVSSLFKNSMFTHITCFYFTIYYFNNKKAFLTNCFNWLMPGGQLVVHLVDKSMFDPILPPANPLLMVSPQRYAKERITHSNVVFDEFRYKANFEAGDGENAMFVEKFVTRKEEKVFRKNKHKLYMQDIEDILVIARSVGFIEKSKLDMIRVQYEYQYLYILQKPE